MRRSSSIGVRWALRNAALFGAALFAVAAFAHFEVKRRVTEDAKLLLELEVRDLVEELGTGALDYGEIADEVDPEIAATAEHDLQIGVQVFDAAGERIYARGRLAQLGVAVPPELESGGSASVFSTVDVPGEEPYWVVSARGSAGYVQVGVSSRKFEESAGHLGRALLAAAPLLALLAGGMGWWIARQSLRPIREMVQVTRGIGFSQLETRVPRSGNGDELDRLAATLNEAFARVEEGAEKLRQFTADAAHELRTPLTRLRSRLEATLARADTPRDRMRRVLEESLAEVRGLSETFSATLLLAESDAGLQSDQQEPVALRDLLEEIVEFYEPMGIEQDVSLVLDADTDPKVPGLPAWLRQTFSNLVQNALVHARTRVTVRLRVGPGDHALIAIEDDGRGIAPEELPRVFDRFYRAKSADALPGSGLGLAIARQMVRAHGGTIEVESRVFRGATFRVLLPCEVRQDRAQ